MKNLLESIMRFVAPVVATVLIIFTCVFIANSLKFDFTIDVQNFTCGDNGVVSYVSLSLVPEGGISPYIYSFPSISTEEYQTDGVAEVPLEFTLRYGEQVPVIMKSSDGKERSKTFTIETKCDPVNPDPSSVVAEPTPTQSPTIISYISKIFNKGEREINRGDGGSDDGGGDNGGGDNGGGDDGGSDDGGSDDGGSDDGGSDNGGSDDDGEIKVCIEPNEHSNKCGDKHDDKPKK